MSVVRMYRCVVVRRYIDILIIIITFPYPLVLALFLAAASILFVYFLKVFSLYACIFIGLYISGRT